MFSLSWDGVQYQNDIDMHLLNDIHMHLLHVHLNMAHQSPSARIEAAIQDVSTLHQDFSVSFTETTNRRLKQAMQQLHGQHPSDFEN